MGTEHLCRRPGFEQKEWLVHQNFGKDDTGDDWRLVQTLPGDMAQSTDEAIDYYVASMRERFGGNPYARRSPEDLRDDDQSSDLA